MLWMKLLTDYRTGIYFVNAE